MDTIYIVYQGCGEDVILGIFQSEAKMQEFISFYRCVLRIVIVELFTIASDLPHSGNVKESRVIYQDADSDYLDCDEQ